MTTQIRILITDGLSAEAIALLRNKPGFTVDARKETSPETLLELIPKAEVLIVRSATKVTAPVLARAESLKLICRAGAGLDNIDVKAAEERGIAVQNTASANSNAAAEHTIALLFAMFRQIPQAHLSIQNQKWERASFSGNEVSGKTLGILGLGNIGQLVAQKALGLGMNVIGYDPRGIPSGLPITHTTSIDAVLSSADVLTLHLPLLPETRGLLSQNRLLQLKKGAWLINCARGGLVDEVAVCDLLDSGHLSGAAFDVFDQEPLTFPNRLAAHPKVITTPHLGASTVEAQQKVGITAAQQIIDFFKQ